MRKESLRTSILELITTDEAMKILAELNTLAGIEGVDVHELSIVDHFIGLFSWHPGKRPIITLEVNLPIKNKTWVLAHEMGHLYTITEIVADKAEVDLIFGEDKELIARVEQAANDWAESYIIERIKGLRNLGRAPERATA